jgi:hypothetical protein
MKIPNFVLTTFHSEEVPQPETSSTEAGVLRIAMSLRLWHEIVFAGEHWYNSTVWTVWHHSNNFVEPGRQPAVPAGTP